MTAQSLDLRRSLHIIRQRLAWVGVVVAAGLLGGIGYALFNPPMLTSNVLVAIPTSTRDASAQLVIITSEPVLAIAGDRLSPAMTPNVLENLVQVTDLTPYLLLISGQSRTSAQAESVAEAVADSYVGYLNSLADPDGPIKAQILQGPTAASGLGLPLDLLITGGIGLLSGAVVGAVAVLATGWRDRRLRDRDQIADAIGVRVLASLHARRPADAASWSRLLQDYQPGAAEAYQLRSALKRLTLVDVDGFVGRPARSVTVVSLLSDRQALALGPQLAAFASSLGISTALVVGSRHVAGPTEALAACAVQPPRSGNSGQLQVVVAEHGGSYSSREADLTVVVAVIDGQASWAADTIRTTTTVLGISAGAANSEQLARVAAGIAASGRNLAGLLIADPSPADETTGRLPRLARPAQKIMPMRMTGTVARG